MNKIYQGYQKNEMALQSECRFRTTLYHCAVSIIDKMCLQKWSWDEYATS